MMSREIRTKVLAEGGITESHAEEMAKALGEATGKRQHMSDESHDDLPGDLRRGP